MVNLSVIMSVYAEPLAWIRQSLESILNQTYRQFEFLIVNDNPDYLELKKALDKYAELDSRIKIISNNENVGLTKSLNRALEVAKGVYIARMDADDYSLPSRFEKQINYLETHPDVVMVGCYAQIMNEKGKISGEMHTGEDYEYLKAMIPFSQPVYHPAMMYKRVINGNPVKYDEKMRASQDYELCCRLISFPITNIPEYLLYYRCSRKQMTKVYRGKYLELEAPIRKRVLLDFYEGISEEDTDAYIKMYYGQKVSQREIDKIETFITNLYKSNKDSNENIKYVITYILIIYAKFLSKNGNLPQTINRFVKVNKCLNNNFYVSTFRYGFSKIANKIRYRFSHVQLG